MRTARGARRNAFAGVLAAFALAAFVVPTAVASAGGRPGGRAPRAFEATPIGIVSQPFHVLTPVNARFTLRLPAGVPTNATVRFSLHRKVANRDSFRAIADHFAEPAVIDQVSVPLRRGVRDAGTTSFDVLINTAQSSRNDLYLAQEGIYPLTIDAVTTGGEVVGTTLTFLHRRAIDTATAVPASVVAALTAPPSLVPDGVFSLLNSTRANVRAFTDFLGSITEPVTAQVQPELLEALATSPEPGDAELFASLRAALTGRRVALAPWVPADIGALVHDGLATQVTDLLTLSMDTFATYLPGVVLQPDVWVARDPLDDASLALLRNLGVTTVLLLPAAGTGVEREADSSLLSRPAGTSNASIAVLSADEAMATTLDGAGDDPVRIGYRIAAEAIALRDDLVAAGGSAGNVRIIISSSSGDLVDGATLRTALRALASAPGIDLREVTDADTVNGTEPATVFPPGAERSLGGVKNGLVQARREYEAVISMLPEADPRSVLWAEQLAVASTGGESAPAQVDGVRSELRRLTGAVSLATAPDITLSSRNGSIRLQLRNDEATTLYVRVSVSSPKITIGSRADVVELLPGSTTDVKVPLRARSNGSFPVTVRITTPSGRVQVVPPTVITASVRAVTGLGQVVSVTLLLMLVAWWWNSWRKRRAEAAQEGTVSGQ